MKKSINEKYYGSNIAFQDMLFNIIIQFVFLFFLALCLINPISKKNDVESKADLMITMSWPDNSPHDVDLWIKLSDGMLIGYPSRENSFIHLERDDLGSTNNYVVKSGEKVGLAPRREVIVFRGKVDGRYVANVHFYMAKSTDGKYFDVDTFDLPVMVELIQINPTYKTLSRKEIKLTKIKEEKTAFAFVISDGNVIDVEQDIEEPFISTYMVAF